MKATVSNTIGDARRSPSRSTPREIDPPTLSMSFAVNDSPFAGKDGDKVQSRVIRDRLEREAEGNVAIRVTETPGGEAFEVAGRGELQLGVLIETLRREGFELGISRPRVLFRDGPSGREEPYETVVIDVDDEFSGTVIDKMAMRKAEMTDMRPSGGGKTRLTFSAPSRGLIGYHGEFLSDTRGTGIMNRLFEKYGALQGPDPGPPERRPHLDGEGRRRSPMRSTRSRSAASCSSRPATCSTKAWSSARMPRPQDLEVNPLKSKQLTNFRASRPQGRRHPPDPAAPDDAWSRRSPTSRTTSWSRSRPRRSASASATSTRTSASARAAGPKPRKATSASLQGGRESLAPVKSQRLGSGRSSRNAGPTNPSGLITMATNGHLRPNLKGSRRCGPR